MKRYLLCLFSYLGFSIISAQVWIPQNDREIKLVDQIFNDFSETLKLNKGQSLQLMTLKYASCDWCKDEMSGYAFEKLKSIPLVFPLADTALQTLIKEQFKNRIIVFNDHVFDVLAKLNFDQNKGYYFQFNLNPQFAQIDAVNASNIKELLANKSMIDFSLNKICKVPVGSFVINYTAKTQMGNFFSDVRHRLFWLKSGDSVANELKLFDQFNYDSILKRIPKPMGEVLYSNELKNLLKDKYTLLGIFPSGEKTVFHIALNYLYKQYGHTDTVVFWKSTLFINLNKTGGISIDVVSMNEVDELFKIGHTNAYSFLYPKPDGSKLLGRIFSARELKDIAIFKNDKSPLAVELQPAKICEVNPTGEYQWSNISVVKSPSFKILKEYNVSNELITKLSNESADFGLIMNTFINNQLFFFGMPYAYDFKKGSSLELGWWRKLNTSYGENLFLRSVTYSAKLHAYLFAFTIKQGMLFAITNENFDLKKLEMIANPMLSSAKIVQEKHCVFQSVDQVYLLKFGFKNE